MAPCWLGELGQSVIDAVVASMDATRRRQLSRPGAKDIKDYHCKPASEEGALELIDSLAGGSSRLRNSDRQPYFLSLAQRHGIDDIPMVRILRSHGLPDDGSEGVPDGTSVPKPPLSEPQTQTRAGEAAADASRQCEEAVLGAAALLTSCSVETGRKRWSASAPPSRPTLSRCSCAATRAPTPRSSRWELASAPSSARSSRRRRRRHHRRSPSPRSRRRRDRRPHARRRRSLRDRASRRVRAVSLYV